MTKLFRQRRAQMKSDTQQLTVPVHGERQFDLVVCGGGFSGVCAAIAAAREGLHVVLIEREGYLGGAATVNLVGPIQSYFFRDRKIVGGIADEIVERLRDRKGTPGHTHTGSNEWHPYLSFDPEILKKVLDDLAVKNNIALYFHAQSIAVDRTHDMIERLYCHTKSGIIAFRAPYFIDATGNADVAYYAECDFIEEADELQAMGMMFRIGGLKDTGTITEKYTQKMREDVDNGKLPAYRGSLGMLGSTLYPDERSVNVTRIKGDPLSAEGITKAEIEGRNQVDKIVSYYRRTVPGYADCRLMATGNVGIRESRKIKGRYVLNESDVINGKIPSDTICLGGWPIDIHGRMPETVTDPNLNAPYGIPYRCLLPEGMNNLLVAGRCISTTHIANSSTRVMPVCMALGEAAGTACALALKTKTRVDRIDVGLLQQSIEANGGILN